MSKPVKTLLRKELARRLEGVDSLVVLSLAGVGGVANNQVRHSLRQKDIRLTVVKNAIARQALKEVGLEPAVELVDGPCAFAIGGESAVSVVREVLGLTKEIPALQVRGALMSGVVFGPDRVEELSKYPTRAEALAELALLATSAGSRLAGALVAPGGRIGGILKALEDRGGGQGPAEAAA
jgi:large subunit ribosomal protein L10